MRDGNLETVLKDILLSLDSNNETAVSNNL